MVFAPRIGWLIILNYFMTWSIRCRPLWNTSFLFKILFEKSIWRFTKHHRSFLWLRVHYIWIVWSIVWIWIMKWSSSNREFQFTFIFLDILLLALLRLYWLLLVIQIWNNTYNLWAINTGLIPTSISFTILDKHLILHFPVRSVIWHQIFILILHWCERLHYLFLLC